MRLAAEAVLGRDAAAVAAVLPLPGKGVGGKLAEPELDMRCSGWLGDAAVQCKLQGQRHVNTTPMKAEHAETEVGELAGWAAAWPGPAGSLEVCVTAHVIVLHACCLHAGAGTVPALSVSNRPALHPSLPSCGAPTWDGAARAEPRRLRARAAVGRVGGELRLHRRQHAGRG